MNYYYDDPVMDEERYSSDREEKAGMYTKCSICGEPIFEDKAVRWNGGYICESCEDEAKERLWEEFRENNFEYIDDEVQ